MQHLDNSIDFIKIKFLTKYADNPRAAKIVVFYIRYQHELKFLENSKLFARYKD